jgi:hypothetical protein
MTKIDDDPTSASPALPRAVLPLGYGAPETSPEWRIALRLMAIAGSAIALGRLISGVAAVFFVIGFAPSFTPMSLFQQFPRLSGLIGAITLGCGSVMVLTGKERRGVSLIIAGEWIFLGLNALYAILILAAATMNPSAGRSTPGAAVMLSSYVSSIGYALTLIAYSGLYILLLRAYRRASGALTQ